MKSSKIRGGLAHIIIVQVGDFYIFLAICTGSVRTISIFFGY